MSASVNVAIVVSGATGAGIAPITLTNRGSAAEVNYPFVTGRVFLPGAMPSGQVPLALDNGTALPTQANVLNRWPDGSVKHVKIAAVIPTLEPGVAHVISFGQQADVAPTPLTAAQMLAVAGFDATVAITVPQVFQRVLGVFPAAAQVSSGWTPITNGGMTLQVNGAPVVVGPINFSTLPPGDANLFGNYLFPAVLAATGHAMTASDWTSLSAPFHYGLVGADLGFATAPPAGMTDISGMLGLSAASGATLVPGTPATVQTVSAKAMLSAGAYRVHHPGPICQTIEIADHSAAMAYDLGLGDGNKPLRPLFYVDFWPGLGKARVRTVVENCKTGDQQDTKYAATVTTGSDVYNLDLSSAKTHWAMSAWQHTAWLGGAPGIQIDMDQGFDYLISTRVLPSYDTTIGLTAAAVSGWDSFFTGYPNDNGDGAIAPPLPNKGSILTNLMSNVGGRPEVSPIPTWWLAVLRSKGDWRTWRLALRLTDISCAHPGLWRESVTGRRLLRTDAVGSSTGFGHCLSITDRRSLAAYSPAQIAAKANNPSDYPVFTGSYSTSPPWTFDGAHEPSTWFLPYVMTCDPWYLQMAYFWASRAATLPNGGATGSFSGRGPTGAEGGITDETRGCGWVLRNRAELAWIAPDADPEKTYFTTLTHDALGRFEGSVGITTGVYHGNSMWSWGNSTGNHQNGVPGPITAANMSPLHVWDTAGAAGVSDAGQTLDTFRFSPRTKYSGSPWMSGYFTYGLVRCVELGFPAQALVDWGGAFHVGMTLDSGLPIMNALEQVPCVDDSTGTWFQSWADIANLGFQPGFRNGTLEVDPAGNAADMLPYYNDAGYDNSYLATAHGTAAELYNSDPRGAANYNWLKANPPNFGLAALTNNGDNSICGTTARWIFVPRTDGIVLPAIPVS